MDRKLLIELSGEGKKGINFPSSDVDVKPLHELFPVDYLRENPAELPQVSIPEVVRHFVNLSTLNHHVDKAMYPLGSCTMKYNPKINEAVAGLSGFSELHPLQSVQTVQGALRIYKDVEDFLCAITGMAAFTLQPAAGSHGELTGVMIMRQYHKIKGNKKRVILIPDSAHGTNPASVAIGGFDVKQVKSTKDGLVDLDDLKEKIDEEPDVPTGTVEEALEPMRVEETPVSEAPPLRVEAGAFEARSTFSVRTYRVNRFLGSGGIEEAVWEDALRKLESGGIKQALEQLLGATCSAQSTRERTNFRLLTAKLCLEANRPDLARPIAEELNALIGELQLERWESPIWIAEVLDTLFQCLIADDATEEDSDRARGLRTRICTLDVTRAMEYND